MRHSKECYDDEHIIEGILQSEISTVEPCNVSLYLSIDMEVIDCIYE